MEREARPRAARLEVLRGTLDASSPLAALRGNGLVWSSVFGEVDRDFLERRIARAGPGVVPFHAPGTTLEFPPPTPGGLDVNMMPFYLHRGEQSLPPELRQYARMIWSCGARPHGYTAVGDDFSSKRLWDHVAYLTVHETEAVPAGRTQRRPGLHVERPGHAEPRRARVVARPDRDAASGEVVRRGAAFYEAPEWREYATLAWGLGDWEGDHPVDGIFVASTAAGTTAVYPALVERPEEVCDASGGLPEAARPLLGEPRLLGAGELCWMTDRTPHEARPDPAGGGRPRQFFRLVVGRISAWYARHSTPNPMGVPPDAPVSHEDKFAVGVAPPTTRSGSGSGS